MEMEDIYMKEFRIIAQKEKVLEEQANAPGEIDKLIEEQTKQITELKCLLNLS
jgi:hypothetical protein